MIEYVLRPEVHGRNGRSLGAMFHKELLSVYGNSDLPVLTGLYAMDALQTMLLQRPKLHRAALAAIRDVKTFSSGLPGILGQQAVQPQDSLLGVWRRVAANSGAAASKLGRPKKERRAFEPVQQKDGARFTAKARRAFFLWRHQSHATQRALSMRGAKRLALGGVQLLLNVAEDDLKSFQLPSAGTASTIDRSVHAVQRVKEVELTFAKQTFWVGTDGGSRKKQSFVAGAVGAVRPHDQRRAYECFVGKLSSKSGQAEATAAVEAVIEMGAPLDKWEFLVTDNTNTMIGLIGGMHNHVCLLLREKTNGQHCVVSRVPCSSHVAHNESFQVLKSMGPLRRQPDELLAHRKSRNEDVSGSRWMLVELLEDTCSTIKNTEGCTEHVRKIEGLKTLGQPPLAPEERWGYTCSQAGWLKPSTSRLETAMAYVVDSLLKSHGSPLLDELHGNAAMDNPLHDVQGITFGTMADSLEELCDSHATKLAVLLRELGQPKVRLGLSVIAIYYNESLKPFLDFTENDDGDMFTRVHRVLRQRYTWLADIADDANSTSLAWVTDFEPLRSYVASRPVAFQEINVRAFVAKMFGPHDHASFKLGANVYFEQHTSAFFENPLLLQYGLLDGKGGFKDTLELLLSMDKQDGLGFYEAVSQQMPDSVRLADVQAEFERHGYEGSGNICSPVFRAILHDINALAAKGYSLSELTLERVVHENLVNDSIDIMRHLEEVAGWLPISNFKREQQVKTAKTGVHHTVFQRTETLEVYMAAAHRDEDCLYDATEEDYRWAECEERRKAAARRERRAGAPEKLPTVTGLVDVATEEEDDDNEGATCACTCYMHMHMHICMCVCMYVCRPAAAPQPLRASHFVTLLTYDLLLTD